MTVKDQSGGSHPNPILTSRGELSLSTSPGTLNAAIQLSEQISEYSLKVRKPYTITKQRERWTEEEHKKFLEALKLYGRAWRRIEEHVGTKTAVQIRSHAQKFFSKVVRESSGGMIEQIEIPPPRPKRKPAHPYPRKYSDPLITTELSKEDQQTRSVSPNSSVSDQEQQSPTSVLSASGLASGYPSSTEDIGSPDPSQVPDPMAVASVLNEKLELFPDLSETNKGEAKEVFSRTGSFKLFGAMFPVSNIEQSGSTMEGVSESNTVEMSPWLTLGSNGASSQDKNSELSSIVEEEGPTSRQSSDMKTQPGQDEGETRLGWSSGSEKPNCVPGSSFVQVLHKDAPKGFVPYKRYIADKIRGCEKPCSEDELEKQRTRLCL